MFVDLSYLKSGFSDKLRVLTFHIALKNLLKLKTPLIILKNKTFNVHLNLLITVKYIDTSLLK